LSVSVNGLLANFAVAFTQPTVAVFALLFTGAVLVRGRHTVTRMILAAGVRVRHHARFHRFFSRSRWTMDDLWKGLAHLVADWFLSKDRPVRLGGDDTAQKKTGAKIYGAGIVHDNRPAARKGWDFCWGLTWVVLTVLVPVPLWPGHVFAIPVGVRLYRKKKFCTKESGHAFKTKPQLLLEMVRQLVEWLPDYAFLLHVDGGYANGELMQSLPKNVHVVGRMRFDAALYDRPPKRQRPRRGRARERGKRLARPKLHVALRPEAWTTVTLARGKRYEIQSWLGLWWKVFRERPLLVVASRRAPRHKGDHPGDVQFFYTTDLAMTPQQVLEAYADRWAIECLFHEVKERMGFEEPQCRTEKAVERTAPFLLWTAGVAQYWFLSQKNPSALVGWRPRWWNKRKAATTPPSFSEMLGALRRDILRSAFECRSASDDQLHQNLRTLIESAALAA
jgi:hypothetical protein